METFEFDWMNGGRPFAVSAPRLTPATYRAATLAKNHALVEATRGLPADAHPDVAKTVLGEANTLAAIAQMNSFVYGALVGVDAKLREQAQADVIERIPLNDYMRLAQAIGEGLSQGAGAVPNGALKPNSVALTSP